MNSPSEHGPAGGRFSRRSFFATRSSTKLLRAASSKTRGSILFGNGETTTAEVTLLEYQTLTAASPWPATVTLPSRLTFATSSSLEVNFAHRVTSSEWPSLYHARTSSCAVSFGFSTDDGG